MFDDASLSGRCPLCPDWLCPGFESDASFEKRLDKLNFERCFLCLRLKEILKDKHVSVNMYIPAQNSLQTYGSCACSFNDPLFPARGGPDRMSLSGGCA